MKHASAVVVFAAVILAAAGCASSPRLGLGVPPLHREHPSVRITLEPLPRPVAPCTGRCIWDRQGRLDALAAYATRVADAAHVFAGVVIDVPGNHVILYLVHAPQWVIDRIEQGHGDTYVIHNDAPRTYHDVTALQNSLDWNAWKAKGVDIVSTGPTQTGYLEVGVMSNIAKAQELFDAAYPDGAIHVVHGEMAMPTDATGPTGR